MFAYGVVIKQSLVDLLGEASTKMVQPLFAGHLERERFIQDILSGVIRFVCNVGRQNLIFAVDGQVFCATVGKRVMRNVRRKVYRWEPVR